MWERINPAFPTMIRVLLLDFGGASVNDEEKIAETGDMARCVDKESSRCEYYKMSLLYREQCI